MSKLIAHAEKEMRSAGLYDADADYEGMIPRAVMDLVEAHSKHGHSGASHWLVMEIFNKVINFKLLTPVTDNPDEWMDIYDGGKGPNPEPLWQSRRQPSLFSNDAGKSYYDLDEKDRPIHQSENKT